MAPRNAELHDQMSMLLRLWEDIRWIARAMPKTIQVPAVSEGWVTNPPTRNVIPGLIRQVQGQQISDEERVMVLMGLTAWSDAYTVLIGISSLPGDQCPPEMLAKAAKSLDECSGWLEEVVKNGGFKRDLRLKGRAHGESPRRNQTPRAPGR